ncbi:MAG: hypothetical protein Greene071436_109, partial [Parcubacteria group bacterium Greene0714_36]
MPVESGAMFVEIKNSLGGVPVEFVPLAVVYKNAITEHLALQDCFVVDIGENETTLLSLRDGRFSHAAFIPLGARRITAPLPKLSGAAQWKKSFVSAIESFAAAGPLPADLLLTGGGAYIPEIRAALLAPDWMAGVSYAAAPRLRVLEGNTFFGGDTVGGYLQGAEDAGLAALAVYAGARHPVF